MPLVSLLFFQNSDEISSLVLFVTDSASSSPIVLDARSLGVPTSTELMYWFQQSNHTVYYGNMNTYRIYTFSFNDLIPVKTLSHYEINGYCCIFLVVIISVRKIV